MLCHSENKSFDVAKFYLGMCCHAYLQRDDSCQKLQADYAHLMMVKKQGNIGIHHKSTKDNNDRLLMQLIIFNS